MWNQWFIKHVLSWLATTSLQQNIGSGIVVVPQNLLKYKDQKLCKGCNKSSTLNAQLSQHKKKLKRMSVTPSIRINSHKWNHSWLSHWFYGSNTIFYTQTSITTLKMSLFDKFIIPVIILWNLHVEILLSQSVSAHVKIA